MLSVHDGRVRDREGGTVGGVINERRYIENMIDYIN